MYVGVVSCENQAASVAVQLPSKRTHTTLRSKFAQPEQ